MADGYDSENERAENSQSQSTHNEGEEGEEEEKENPNFLENLQNKTEALYKKPKKDGKTDTTSENLDTIGYEECREQLNTWLGQ